MLDGLLMARVILASASLFFALKACWHWHESSETLNGADIAGLSDGRCPMSLLAEVTEERKRLRIKSQISLGLASVSTIAVAMVYLSFD